VKQNQGRKALLSAISIILAASIALVLMPVQTWAATAPQPAASPSASSTQAGQGSDGTVWYLAEGYTGGDFDTYVLVQNPGTQAAKVTLDFQLPPGLQAPSYKVDVPAGTRKTVHLDELPGLGATDVSTRVVSNRPVVAERAMYFSYNGKVGGHDSIGVKYPRRPGTWLRATRAGTLTPTYSFRTRGQPPPG